MKLWILPIEPLEQRYSSQWIQLFGRAFRDSGISHEFIYGEPTDSCLDGKFFLDPVATSIWKATQLSRLLHQIDFIGDDDVVLAFDGWFPGIEALGYIRDMLGKRFKLAAYFHAGSYDPEDLTSQTGMWQWASGLEESWMQMYDKVFVATNFHKDLIKQNSLFTGYDKISVVGFPLDVSGIRYKYYTEDKKDQIVFTGRKSHEKGYETIKNLQSDYDIVITQDMNLSKHNYYKLLAESKVVIAPSLQETFGIGVVEGMILGCVPVVPDRLAFKETVQDQRFRYQDTSDIPEYIETALNEGYVTRRDLSAQQDRYQYEDIIMRIVRELIS